MFERLVQEERGFHRKNAFILPLYWVLSVGAIFVEDAAIIQVPGLQGSDRDLALLRLSISDRKSVV